MFSGLLVCPDCGGNLNYHFNQANPEIKYFNCANYNSRRQCASTHYVRVDFLEQVVLGEIRRLTRFASRYEDEFVKTVMGRSQLAAASELQCKSLSVIKIGARSERNLSGFRVRIDDA